MNDPIETFLNNAPKMSSTLAIEWLRSIKNILVPDRCKVSFLKELLEQAIKNERYEECAFLKSEIELYDFKQKKD
jgi:protein-arginine kinase activator protein McsA